MRHIINALLFFLFSLANLLSAESFVVLTYGHFDEVANKIAVLEVPASKIEALQKVTVDIEFRVNPTKLFAAAKRALELNKQSIIQIGHEWLFEARSEEKKHIDPLGDLEPVVSNFNWRVIASTMREIDTGRSRDAPWVWKQESSGRYWWEVRLRAFDDRNQSVTEIVVFLLQDYSVILPHFVTPSQNELIQIKKAKTSAKED